jgi:hypothetical protein
MGGEQIIVRPRIMSTTLKTNGDAANVLPITTDKRGLAARYLVGIRTIELWKRDGIIIGTRHGKRLIFDVGDCDRRLLQFKNQKNSYGNN